MPAFLSRAAIRSRYARGSDSASAMALSETRLPAAREAELHQQPHPVLRLRREDHASANAYQRGRSSPGGARRAQRIGWSRVSRMLDPSTLGDHIDRLYRAACALTGSRAAADDLVQETYARVLAKPRLLKNDDDIGYLVRTMRNVFLDQRRQAARRATDPVDPEDFERVAGRSARPAEEVERRELLGLIFHAAGRVPRRAGGGRRAGCRTRRPRERSACPRNRHEPALPRAQARGRGVRRLEVDGAMALPARELGQLGVRHAAAGQDAGVAVALPRGGAPGAGVKSSTGVPSTSSVRRRRGRRARRRRRWCRRAAAVLLVVDGRRGAPVHVPGVMPVARHPNFSTHAGRRRRLLGGEERAARRRARRRSAAGRRRRRRPRPSGRPARRRRGRGAAAAAAPASRWEARRRRPGARPARARSASSRSRSASGAWTSAAAPRMSVTARRCSASAAARSGSSRQRLELCLRAARSVPSAARRAPPSGGRRMVGQTHHLHPCGCRTARARTLFLRRHGSRT